ncbi:hypothetical protein OH77DRAFT_696085 [Trametes cingulata]|nr:hypothetical protein OH77DRAFT_696085 [Trametes cingulata]
MLYAPLIRTLCLWLDRYQVVRRVSARTCLSANIITSAGPAMLYCVGHGRWCRPRLWLLASAQSGTVQPTGRAVRVTQARRRPLSACSRLSPLVNYHRDAASLRSSERRCSVYDVRRYAPLPPKPCLVDGWSKVRRRLVPDMMAHSAAPLSIVQLCNRFT